MTKALVVYGSRHGGTQGIAERIGEVLRAEGVDAVVASADHARDVGSADAFVIGSGVYMGSWLNEPLDFVRNHADILASRPVWLFSSGPLPGATGATNVADPMELALGPAQGPGSGGRKKLDELTAATHPRGHRVFHGAFDPKDPPRAMSERLVRLMPVAKRALPAGDFRNWDDIEAWAREIAASLASPVSVP